MPQNAGNADIGVLTPPEVLKCIEPCLQHLLRAADAKYSDDNRYVDQLQIMATAALDPREASALGSARKRQAKQKAVEDDQEEEQVRPRQNSTKDKDNPNALALDKPGAITIEWTLKELEAGAALFTDGILQSCEAMFEKTVVGGDDSLWHPGPDDEYEYHAQERMALWEATLQDPQQSESSKVLTLGGLVAKTFRTKVVSLRTGEPAPISEPLEPKATLPENDEGDFFDFNPFPDEREKGPIVDVKVLLNTKRPDKVPPEYEVIKRSLCGQSANLGKQSGGRPVFLCVKRTSAKDFDLQEPITAIAILCCDEKTNEHVPFGFELVEDCMSPGSPGNLSSNQSPIYLAVHRGQGAPLADISIVFKSRDTFALPDGFHAVITTPSGLEANIVPQPSGAPCFICVRPDIAAAMRPFREYVKKFRNSDGSVSFREEGFAQTLGTLVAALYCHRNDLTKTVFDAFRFLPVSEIPAELVNLFVSALCDAMPHLWSWVAPELRTNSLAFLLWLQEETLHLTTAGSILKILKVFAFTQQSKEAGYSTGYAIVNSVVSLLSKLQPKALNNSLPTEKKCAGFLAELTESVIQLKRLEPLQHAFFAKDEPDDDLIDQILPIIDALAMKRIQWSSSAFKAEDSKPDYGRMESLAIGKQVDVGSRELALELAEKERQALENERLLNMKNAKEREKTEEAAATKHHILHELRLKPLIFMALPRDKSAAKQHVVIKLHLLENIVSFHFIDVKSGPLQVMHFPREGLKSLRIVETKALYLEFNKPREFKKEFEFQTTEYRDAVFELVSRHMGNPSMPGLAAGFVRDRRGVDARDSLNSSSMALMRSPTTTSIPKHAQGPQIAPADVTIPDKKDLSMAVQLSFRRARQLFDAYKEIPRGQLHTDEPVLAGSEAVVETPKHSHSRRMAMSTLALRLVEPNNVAGHIALERKLLATLLFACKLAQDSEPSQVSGGSGCSPIRVYGCNLLEHTLASATSLQVAEPRPSFNRSFQEALPMPRAYTALLRRFVCPTLVICSISRDEQVLKPTLQSFERLWKGYHEITPVENGILLQHICVDYLRSPFLHPLQKLGVLDLMNNTVFASFPSAMNLFYNYDNQDGKLDGGFDVYKHIVKTVCEVATSSARVLYYKRPVPVRTDDGQESNPIDTLRVRCFGVLADFLDRCAAWISTNVPKLATGQLTQITERLGRGVVWVERYRTRKQKDAIFKQAVEVFKKSKKMKQAMALIRDNLKILEPGYDDKRGDKDMVFPRVVAQFLQDYNKSLDKAEIGEVISMLDDPFMLPSQWLELRWAFVKTMDFSYMSLDEALRHYLLEGGFRLPGEAQRIDRLLEAFCRRYCTCNPGAFKSSDAAFILAFAMIMLNTDIHDTRLVTAGKKREKMTLAQFMHNLRGTNDKEDFPRALLEASYNSIVNETIAWKEGQPEPQPQTAPLAVEEDESFREEQLSLQKRNARIAKQKERQTGITKLVRNSMVRLRQRACFDRTWCDVSNSKDVHTGLSLAIWDLTSQHIFTALTHAAQSGKDIADLAILRSCLQATKAMKAIFSRLDGEGPRYKAFDELSTKLELRSQIVSLRRAIESSGLIKDSRYHLKKYPNCVCASELIDWLSVNGASDTKDAVNQAQSLVHVGLTCIVGDAKEREIPLKDDKRLYEFKPLAEAWGEEQEEDDLDWDEPKEPATPAPSPSPVDSPPQPALSPPVSPSPSLSPLPSSFSSGVLAPPKTKTSGKKSPKKRPGGIQEEAFFSFYDYV